MTTITIRTIGNRSLYRSIYESIDSSTTHRTAGGAARRYMTLLTQIEDWGRNYGKWGRVEIEVDGRLVEDHADFDGPYDGPWSRHPTRANRLANATRSFEHLIAGDDHLAGII